MLFCLVRNELQGCVHCCVDSELNTELNSHQRTILSRACAAHERSRDIGSITVRDILSRQPPPPSPPPTSDGGRPAFPSIHEARTVLDAIAAMARLNAHALVVLDDAGALVGIITERDYVLKVKVEGRASVDTPIRDVMTATPWCASLDFTLDDVLELMTRYGFRHMPVVGAVGEAGATGERERVAAASAAAELRPRCHGLISIVDVMRTITEWPDRPMTWPDNEAPLPGPL